MSYVMLHESLSRYLNAIENRIEKIGASYIEKYREHLLTHTRANLSIRIRFSSGHLLEISEALTVYQNNVECISYRYHFQDGSGALIFRYDDTPHFPALPDFPCHRHAPEAVISCTKPDLLRVCDEITGYFQSDSAMP